MRRPSGPLRCDRSRRASTTPFPARIDDEQTAPDPPVAPATTDDDSDDLLADLRESLQAMETVAEEMERASESRPPTEPAPEPAAQEAVAGGARIVPLRASDP